MSESTCPNCGLERHLVDEIARPKARFCDRPACIRERAVQRQHKRREKLRRERGRGPGRQHSQHTREALSEIHLARHAKARAARGEE